jgi:polyisoprenoid-binding protein YceI
MKRRGWLYAIALATLLSGNTATAETRDETLCAPFGDGLVDPERVQAMRNAAADGHLYRIIPATSRVGFCVDSEYARIKADFRTFQGGLSLWPDAGDKEQAMVVVSTDSLDTGGSMADFMLKSRYFFDVEHYPEILFVSTAIEWTDPVNAELRGELTLRGVTRPVTFRVQLTEVEQEAGGQIDRIIARAGTVIDRTDFGMDRFPDLVDSKVELCMSVEAVRYPGTDDAPDPVTTQR